MGDTSKGRNRLPDVMHVRPAQKSELDHLARVWHDSWRDGHAHVVPAELTRRRTLESFRSRLQAAFADIRVVGPIGAPVGFCIVMGDELSQLFVSASARGTGVAGALMADAEARLVANGVDTAWLTCAIGNDNAARFYERRGWYRARIVVSVLDTPEGPFPLEVWRYEKKLSSRPRVG